MQPNSRPKLRFSLKSLLVLVMGIAIGYSLNLETFRLLAGRWWYATAPGPYVIEPPDVLKIGITYEENGVRQFESALHLVGPDGRINLDKWGTVYVAGMHLDEAQEATREAIGKHVALPDVSIYILAFNSKVYYVITPAAGGGNNVAQFQYTGNETVLDAIAQIGGISMPSASKVSVARPNETLQVDWQKIASGKSTATNYCLMSGDRVVVDTSNVGAN
jgi:protein involved in polysaccharide export with SLBB domain